MLTVQEHESPGYAPRTHFNAQSAAITAAFAVDMTTAGERLTKIAAGPKYIGFEISKESDPLVIARKLYKEIKLKYANTLNIAGNGIYTLSQHGWSQEEINLFVYDVLKPVSEHLKLKTIYTGGQTGVDIAGAVAGYALGIDTIVTLPKGFRQRLADETDVRLSREVIEKQIKKYSKQLV